MNADTQLRPARTDTTTTVPPIGSRVRPPLVIFILTLTIGVALVIAAAYGTPRSTDLQPPSVSPGQAERWGTDDRPVDLDREARRFRNAVDVDRR